MANQKYKLHAVLFWLVGLALFVLLWIQLGRKTALLSLIPLIPFVDLVIWFFESLIDLPCGFTEWVCYPGYIPKVHERGLAMRWGVLIRIAEIVIILVWGFSLLFTPVKSLF